MVTSEDMEGYYDNHMDGTGCLRAYIHFNAFCMCIVIYQFEFEPCFYSRNIINSLLVPDRSIQEILQHF